MRSVGPPEPVFTDHDHVLEVEDLEVDFRTEDGTLHAVRGVSYVLRRGEVLGIVGESGSGKSVTSLAIMGLLPRTATVRGSARLEGQELLNQRRRDINAVRGKTISMIFQDPMTSLNPVHRVGEQIAESILAHRDVTKKEAREEAVATLARVGIPQPDQRARSYPHEFSGGMRQRAMIAMAMANEPAVVIADEPTTALDVTVQAQILETLIEQKERSKAAFVLITHDLGVVASMADRVLVMYAGRPVEIGTIDQVYASPRMPYTLGLLGSLPRVDVGERKPLTPIAGSPPSMVNPLPGCPFAPRCPLATDRCRVEEPPLRDMGDGHLAACHYAERLAEPGMDSTIFIAGHDNVDRDLPGYDEDVATEHLPTDATELGR
ncbi:ABC transporter ATP-binding protein [Actinomarinicola tropica]|uniref:ATP-binding cassette domain-containing protein n=1 Tax=Actinomarinicola tropica TaxID=2789776 RepID=A0A5Q2RNH7_9ACTN|nr:ABC transporter ATP-binding protein [Actinomarinicola tropica]QGG95450.1 ATP-binding cassette domain-containing protein [Actinomarinicola tropica]